MFARLFFLTKDCIHNEVWGCAETLPKVLPHSLEPKLKLSSRLQTVLLKIQYLRNSKWSRITADLNILKASRKESQTIRIKTLTSVSCSVRFEVFSCDSCFAGKNSGLLQIEIKVFSQFHRVCLLDSTIATYFRRIQAKFDRFYSNFRLQGPLPCAHIRHTEFRSHTLHTQ